MTAIAWGVVLDLSDHTTDTDASIGMVSGVIYWITGRPGYAGSGYSGEAPAGKTWKQGIITEASISPVVRIAEGVEKTGGYGTLSGFDFTIDNSAKYAYSGTDYPFWRYLRLNGYRIVNRPLKLFCFLDSASYQVWGGVVGGYEYTQGGYRVICEDSWTNLHTMIPPLTVTRDGFPEADERHLGAVVPVCLGDVPKAPMVPVKYLREALTLATFPVSSEMAPAAAFTSVTRQIYLHTPGKTFAENELRGLFLHHAVGGSGTYLITKSDASVVGGLLSDGDLTAVYISGWFSSPPTSDDTLTTDTLTSKSIWYFQIVAYQASYVYATKEVTSGSGYLGLPPQVLHFDDTLFEYQDNSFRLATYSRTDEANTGLPGVTLTERYLSENEKIIHLFTMIPAKIVYWGSMSMPLDQSSSVTVEPEINEALPYLYDRARADFHQLAFETANPQSNVAFDFLVDVPEDILAGDYDRITVAVDLTLETPALTSYTGYIKSTFYLVDYTGRTTQSVIDGNIDVELTGYAATNDIYCVPSVHYNARGDDLHYHDIQANIELSSIIDSADGLKAYPKILHRLEFLLQEALGTIDVVVKLREMVFACAKSSDPKSATLYTRVFGGEVLS